MTKVWENFLLVLALVYLAAFSYPAFVTEISTSTQNLLEILQWITWAIFALDLSVGIWKASDKKKYLKTQALLVLSTHPVATSLTLNH